MTTCDAAPQRDEWIDILSRFDGVLTYTEYAAKLLRSSGLKVVGQAPPAYPATFIPNREEARRWAGIPKDAKVIGMVGRNGPRKLIGELIRAFGRSNECDYLYLHTGAYGAWDIPRHLQECGRADRVLFTYTCKCGWAKPLTYKGNKVRCSCGGEASMSETNTGAIEQSLMPKVYSVMDVYAQISTNEGFGLPVVEAAACGARICGIGHGATEEVVSSVGGYCLYNTVLYTEQDMGRELALPLMLDLDECFRNATVCPRDEIPYSYELSAITWAGCFGNSKGDWNTIGQLAPELPPDGLSPEKFVRHCVQKVAYRNDLVGTYTEARMVRDLSNGYTGLLINEPYTKKNVLNWALSELQAKNYWEGRLAASYEE